MPCATPSNCSPCASCGQTAGTPIVPRCNDVVLTDGTYTNATIVVENGCVSVVESGEAPLYQPEACCAAPGSGGGGGDGLDGPPGPAGQNATISIGTVTGLPFGATPTVTNVGTPTNALLNFAIPRGEDGTDGDTVTGATSNLSGIVLDNGVIKDPLPLGWGPLLTASFVPSAVAGVTLLAAKDDSTGALTLTVDVSAYAAAVQATLTTYGSRIQNLEDNFNTLQSFTVASLPNPVTTPVGQMIYVSNESGGAVPAFNDGVAWRRVTDRAVVT
jgi:hypothetical protein